MGKLSPRIPREHNKYHGYTVTGTPHCPLIRQIHIISLENPLALGISVDTFCAGIRRHIFIPCSALLSMVGMLVPVKGGLGSI